MNAGVSNASNHSVKPNSSDISNQYIPAASHYALKLAFQALKERYDNIQKRLITLEEENINLKEKQSNAKIPDESVNLEITSLEKKIDELSRQKSQLSHHIFMLANENKELWSIISKLNEEKEILIKQLKEFTDKMNYEKNVEEEGSAEPLDCRPNDADNSRDTSLNINLTSVEDDKDSLLSLETVKDFSIVKSDNQKYIVEDLNIELKEFLDKLIEEKTNLQQQQHGLKKTLSTIKRFYQGMKMFILKAQRLKSDKESCTQNSNEVLSETAQKCEDLISESEKLDLAEEVVNDDEMICPFCGKLFVKNTPAEEYDKHFVSHVQSCSNGSMMSLESFEVIDSNI